MKLGLAWGDPACVAFGVDAGIFFETHLDFLALPLGDGRPGRQFNRKPGSGKNLDIAAAGNALLAVP